MYRQFIVFDTMVCRNLRTDSAPTVWRHSSRVAMDTVCRK